MSDFIVEMNHVTKRFPGIVAIDDVTLQVKRGEILAILGENGAGKSTLMSMLFGMYEPDEGEIIIRGKKEEISSPSYAAKLNIGMVHQHFKLVSNYTITENIILGMEPEKKLLGVLPLVDVNYAVQEIGKLSRKYGLEVDPEKVIEDVNVSIQQRVEILKMLYRKAEILIFDEPTGVLTPQEIEFLLEIIKGLRENGKTIILITHKLEEIKQVADRCAILNRGRMAALLPVAQTSTSQMANLMVGREVSFETCKCESKFKHVVLEVDHLTVQNQNGFDAVRDVSFKIHGGEIFAIAGVSGNGQVEIADAISGLAHVSKGRIQLNGTDITHVSIRKRTLEGISYIPEDRQNYGLVMDFTLEDNLLLKDYFREPFSKKGILQHEEFRKYSDTLISNYDIRSGRGNQTVVRTMSGGNQQKTVIAREIERQSSLMIFVQPTRGLDIGAIENIHRQMIGERDKGRAILLVSLELDEIMNCADTIGIIYNGQMQKIAKASSLSTNEVGQFMMGVRSETG